MAIEIKANQVEQPDTIKRRTFRVVIDSPMIGVTHEIVLSREIVPFKNGVQIVGGSEFQIARQFLMVQDETIAMADGSVLTVAQVAQAIALFGDKWDREDHGL